MKHSEIEEDLPILEFFFNQVIEQLERRRIATPRKVSRRRLLATFMRTRDLKATAAALGVSPSLVRQVLTQAIFRARRMAGLTSSLLRT